MFLKKYSHTHPVHGTQIADAYYNIDRSNQVHGEMQEDSGAEQPHRALLQRLENV